VAVHGLALNVDPDLDAFALIVPCGLRRADVTSLRRLGVEPPPLEELAARLVAAFIRGRSDPARARRMPQRVGPTEILEAWIEPLRT
jgi:lipoate-protein ligase B